MAASSAVRNDVNSAMLSNIQYLKIVSKGAVAPSDCQEDEREGVSEAVILLRPGASCFVTPSVLLMLLHNQKILALS